MSKIFSFLFKVPNDSTAFIVFDLYVIFLIYQHTRVYVRLHAFNNYLFIYCSYNFEIPFVVHSFVFHQYIAIHLFC